MNWLRNLPSLLDTCFKGSRITQSAGEYSKSDAYSRHFLLPTHISPFWRIYVSNDNYAVASMLHNPFLASQKEIQRVTQTIQEQNGHHLLYCNTATNTRQNKPCNSKNNTEQYARYLLQNTEHT
jgi:hypothetical protein